jgi:hypothetical protein
VYILSEIAHCMLLNVPVSKFRGVEIDFGFSVRTFLDPTKHKNLEYHEKEICISCVSIACLFRP